MDNQGPPTNSHEYRVHAPWRWAVSLYSCLLISGGVLLSILGFGLGPDQSLFAYMGWALLKGRWPYIGTWDHNFPGIVFTHALQIGLFGDSFLAFRLFDMGYQLIVVALIYTLGRRLAGPTVGFLSGVIYALFYQGLGYIHSGQREGFVLLWLLVPVLIIDSYRDRAPLVAELITGICMGLAVLIKPTYILAIIPLLIFLLQGSPLRSKRTLQVLAMTIVGGLIPLVAFVGIYAKIGGLTAFWESAVRFNVMIHSKISISDLPRFILWLWVIRRPNPLIVVGLLLGLMVPLPKNVHPLRNCLFGLILTTILSIVWQGKFFEYHYLCLYGFATIFLSVLLKAVIDWLWSGRIRDHTRSYLYKGLTVTALLVCLFLNMENKTLYYVLKGDLMGGYAYEEKKAGYEPVYSLFRCTEVAKHIVENTDPDQYVQILGNEISLIYLLAKRFTPGRFFQFFPLILRSPNGDITPMQQRWRKQFLDDLEAVPPQYFVVARNDRWMGLGDYSSEELLEEFPPLKQFLEKNYSYETTIGDFVFYRYADDPAAEGSGT